MGAPGPELLERTAYTVECFFNALRIPDSRLRTEMEEWLVRFLANDTSGTAHAVHHAGSIFCHKGAAVAKSFSLPVVTQMRSVWCDGKKLSVINGDAYAKSHRLEMLGTAGLILTMPGSGAAAKAQTGKSEHEFGFESDNSNNNNNNNNNNG